MRKLNSYRKNESGAIAVEAVFVMPFLFVLSFGALDGSLLMLDNHKMESGLTAAGNYLSNSANPQAFESQAKWLATTGSIKPGGEARIDGWDSSGVTINYRNIANPGQAYRGGENIQIVELSAAYDYQGIGIIKLFSGGSLTLSATHEERVIGSAS